MGWVGLGWFGLGWVEYLGQSWVAAWVILGPDLQSSYVFRIHLSLYL